MTELTFTQDQSHPILVEFPKYIEDWRRLEQEYYQIRSWPIIGFIRQMRNINKRGRLTREYEAKMKSWELTKGGNNVKTSKMGI